MACSGGAPAAEAAHDGLPAETGSVAEAAAAGDAADHSSRASRVAGSCGGGEEAAGKAEAAAADDASDGPVADAPTPDGVLLKTRNSSESEAREKARALRKPASALRPALPNPFAVAAAAGVQLEAPACTRTGGPAGAPRRLTGLARFRAPVRPSATGKLESFDRRIGRAAYALQEVALHSEPPGAGGSRASYLPAWLSAPLARPHRDSRDSRDSGSTGATTPADPISPSSTGSPTSAARPPLEPGALKRIHTAPLPGMRTRSGSAPPPCTRSASVGLDEAAAAAVAALADARPMLLVLGGGGAPHQGALPFSDGGEPQGSGLADGATRALARRLELTGHAGGPSGGALQGLGYPSLPAQPPPLAAHPVSFAPFPSGAAADNGAAAAGGPPRRRRSFPTLASFPSLFSGRASGRRASLQPRMSSATDLSSGARCSAQAARHAFAVTRESHFASR